MLFLTLLKESVLFAFHALRVNRLRTMLSLLGITIGIFAIIAVFTAVDSMANKIRSSVKSLGDNVVFVQKWPWVPEGGGEYAWWKYLNRPVPKIAESDEVRRRLLTAEAVVYNANSRATVYYKTSFIENASLVGTTFEYNKVKTFDLSSCLYFTHQECGVGSSVAIIGSSIAAGVFHDEDPIGKQIKILGRKVTVIGVFKEEGESMMGNSNDNNVLIPLNFARTVMEVEKDEVDPFIMVKVKENVSTADLKDELTGVMRSLRRLKPGEENNFSLNEVSVLSGPMESVFGVIGTVGWIIGAFSILVGGFGIANIMFVSVRERTSQIGIQKSLGAKSWFILMQFLAESVVLCLFGGIIGLLLDWVLVLIANRFIDFGFVLSFNNISLGLTISILIGIISGFIPAYSAAQLDPVEAIRSN
ncbi:MAG: ABC transporter permease [Bacteroidetes bacterium]|nr:ABC transporter permease [Bacteroidota bacterium]